ncbi:putative membrane protein [Variovorax boronicumulans]
MLMQIVLHTPKWVFAVFVLLVWLGARQLLSNSMSLNRVTLMAVAMGGLSLFGVISAFGDSPGALLGWAAAAAVLMALLLQRPLPATTRYDAATRKFHMAGSAVPLMLMMGIFFTKYAVAATLALHPELRHHAVFALAIPVLYGAFTGIFVGRAVRLWKLAMAADAVASGARPA